MAFTAVLALCLDVEKALPLVIGNGLTKVRTISFPLYGSILANGLSPAASGPRIKISTFNSATDLSSARLQRCSRRSGLGFPLLSFSKTGSPHHPACGYNPACNPHRNQQWLGILGSLSRLASYLRCVQFGFIPRLGATSVQPLCKALTHPWSMWRNTLGPRTRRFCCLSPRQTLLANMFT
jgi:hypothetical protein